MLRSGVWSLLGVSTFFYLAAACGSSDHASPIVGGTAGSASNASTAGTGPDLGNADNGGTSNSSGGSTGSGETCAADLVKAERIPLDMYVMLDVSGSMLSPTEGDVDVTKWQAVSSALNEFFSDTSSDGLGVGLQVFPIHHADAPASCTSNAQCGDAFGPCFLKTCWNYPGGLVACDSALDCGEYGPCVTYGTCENNADYVCNRPGTGLCGTDEVGNDLGNCQERPSSVCLVTADCRAATYATPAAEIATLPAGRAELIATLAKTMPDENGLTPTGPALEGAIQQAKAWATAHPDHQVVAVLATDGEPTLQTNGNRCGPVEDQADLQAVVNL
ncbi:MAG TPA: VWA domain-containing protein, partial [Polyangiaceae bacterium]|nr:VWA domain-containing protein [Polyangiaceae bacterium]